MSDKNRLKVLGLISAWLMLMVSVGEAAAPGTPESPNTLADIQNRIIALRNEFKARMQLVEQDQKAIQDNLGTKLRELVDKQQSVDASHPEWKANIEAINVLLEAHNANIAALEQTLTTIETTLNDNLNGIEPQIAAIKKEGINKVVEPSPNEPQPEPGASFDFSEGQIFRAAYRIYMDGDYSTAIAGFQKLLEEYPHTKLAGAAQYWIAESFVKLEDYATAIQEYDLLITKYPHDDKTPDAYYGKGAALIKSGKMEEGKALFTYVVEHFPGTVAAKRAGERIAELK